ncbi:MAG TPA: DUF2971 domain-containing protein [Bryobacteraceae bacterium]|nr:DUF2971 domain-containing protein [Bryobacteraceae bacterium]
MSTRAGATSVRRGEQDAVDIFRVPSEAQEMTLYHYTTQTGLLGIITSREVWATHHQCLNDPKEFVHAKELFREELASRGPSPITEAMQRTLQGEGLESVDMYVASFSEDSDSLSQWRAYGGPTSSFSLGFDRVAPPSRFKMRRCIYQEDRQREWARNVVDGILRKLQELDPKILEGTKSVEQYIPLDCRLPLHESALVLKHPKFAEEKEWRIFSEVMMDDPPNQEKNPLDFREGKSALVPYRRVPLKNNEGGFPLTEIVVGPSPDPERSRRTVLSLLRSRGLANCHVRTSDVPYRNW